MVDPGLLAQIDYTSRDYAGYRDSLLTYASQIMPQWTSRSPADFGVMMVELFSYMGDIISFYQDRIVDEGFLATATQRSSVVAIAQQLGYTPFPAAPATGYVNFSPTPALTSAYTLPQGTQVVTAFQTAYDAPIFFETSAAAVIPAYTTPVPVVTVPVVEGRTQGTRQLSLYVGGTIAVEDLGTSNGTVSQTFALAQQPVILSTVRVFIDDGTGGTEWIVQPDFLLQPATAQIFTVSTDDNGVAHIAFGDGVNGAIPQSNMKITASYRIGGGSYGNVPANSIVDLAAPISGIAVATPNTSSAMTGGANQESLDSIRANAPRQFSAQGRAVALADYANLALNVPGIVDANAVGNSSASVTIYCLGPGGTQLSQQQLDAVVNYVQPLGLAGVTVTAFNGTYVYINLGTSSAPVNLGVLPRYSRAAVVAAVTSAWQGMWAPGVGAFGQRISLSHIYETLQEVPGVDYIQIPVMARYDMPQSGTVDILLKAGEFPAYGTLNMTASGGV
jgi:uncharacterized phage protein gp47/JayE